MHILRDAAAVASLFPEQFLKEEARRKEVERSLVEMFAKAEKEKAVEEKNAFAAKAAERLRHMGLKIPT